jgi:hypothetical protein
MIDIFIKTYYKDFKWLYFTLESIKKFVNGYNEIIIVMPSSDFDRFDFSKITDIRCRICKVVEYGNGYLYQQYIKLSAHRFSNSKYILFVDSDCIFDHEINLEDLVKDRVKLYYTHYSKVGDAICWKAPTEKFIGGAVEYEFMRSNFLMYHRQTIININNSYPNLEKYIMETNPLFGFSEFNVIGAWIYYNEKDIYDLVNTDESIGENIGIQFWSHSGITDDELEKIKKILE